MQKSVALWVIVILAILGWWFLRGQATNVADQTKNAASKAVQSAETVADQTKNAATKAVQSAETLKVGATDIGSTIQQTTDDLRQSLQGITDAAAAKAALPKLQDAAAQFDKVDSLVDQLPAAEKTALAALIVALRPSLDALFAKALAIPGASEYIKPSIDAINAKFDKLAKAGG